jgi:hypothetical protein
MQFIRKIATSIYCDLVTLGGLKVDPPRWMFNIPKELLPHLETHQILADINFTPKERWLIEEAARNIEWFSNGLIKMRILFEWDPAWNVNENLTVMLRVPSTEKMITDCDGYYKNTVLGLCNWMKNNSVIIHMVHDRLQDEHTFRTTAIHEIGHYLGLGHLKKPSIMYKSNYMKVLYMTYNDAVEFARIYQIDPESLRYFRL